MGCSSFMRWWDGPEPGGAQDSPPQTWRREHFKLRESEKKQAQEGFFEALEAGHQQQVREVPSLHLEEQGAALSLKREGCWENPNEQALRSFPQFATLAHSLLFYLMLPGPFALRQAWYKYPQVSPLLWPSFPYVGPGHSINPCALLFLIRLVTKTQVRS